MKLVRRLILLIFLLVVAVAVFQNQQSLGQSLEFSFLKWSTSMVLGFWILFAFAAGAAAMALINAWKGLWLRREIRKRDGEISRLEKEATKARRGTLTRRDPTTSSDGETTPE